MSSQQPIPSALSDKFYAANWIWTPESGGPTSYAAGSRAFRRTYIPSGKASNALVLITADDAFTLFVNEVEVGSGAGVTKAQIFNVPSLSLGDNHFAISATNSVDGPAGVLLAIQINFSDKATQDFVVSDDTWRTFNSVPSNFASHSLDDTVWDHARLLGTYGSGAPWFDQVTLPSTDTSLLPTSPSHTISSITSSRNLPTSTSRSSSQSNPTDTASSTISTSTSSIILPTNTTLPISSSNTSAVVSPTITSPAVPSPIASPALSPRSPPVKIIVGAIIGGLGFIICVLAIILFIRRRKRKVQASLSSGDSDQDSAKVHILRPFPSTLPQPGQFWNRGYRLGSFGREKQRDNDVFQRSPGDAGVSENSSEPANVKSVTDIKGKGRDLGLQEKQMAMLSSYKTYRNELTVADG